MPPPEVGKALRDLCDFRPTEWGPAGQLSSKESQRKQAECDELIRRTARFVEAVENQGGEAWKKLAARSCWLDEWTAPGTRFENAWQAVRVLVQASRKTAARGLPERGNANLQGPRGDYLFFPMQLGGELVRANEWLEAHPRSRKKNAYRHWRDELWAVHVEAERQHFWGSHLAMLCHVARHPSRPQFEFQKELQLACWDLPGIARAIQAAARDLMPGQGHAPASRATHSPDFRSVHWFGQDYHFTPGQAACVAVLWAAWEKKTPAVGQRHILAEAELDSTRLSDLFKGHPAWKTMIVPGKSKGTYQLQEPDPSRP
jgi:hypothetical protein